MDKSPDKPKSAPKYFVFSDESGSWHDIDDVYVRAWIVLPEQGMDSLTKTFIELKRLTGAKEIKWKTIASDQKYLSYFNDLNFRMFITISSPRDILWEIKYNIIRDFNSSMDNFAFGNISNGIKQYIRSRIHREIRNSLFLHYYEKCHIENAKAAIGKIVKPTEYELIYRIDPPQMSQEGWKEVLKSITSAKNDIEFPKSNKSYGVQFADIISGSFRSLLLQDEKFINSRILLKNLKGKMIPKNIDFPNPNLIFYGEINETLKSRSKIIWNL